jgi:hypothetical protein
MCLILPIATVAAAQDIVRWTKTSIKAKGEAYNDATDAHRGTASIGAKCFHRVTFVGNDDDSPAVRQFCRDTDLQWDADDLSFDYYELPQRNLLLDGSFSVSLDDRDIDVDGFFRLLVERKNGRPKAVTLRQRNAIGDASRDGSPPVDVRGAGLVNGLPIAVADLPDFLQAVAAQRSKLMRCGSSSRDVTTFIPSGVELTLVTSCTPDADTQALLVTRSGAASLSDVVVQAYVSSGGIVITEFNVSDEVFNMVFGTAVAQGARLGACADNVNPAVRFRKKNPFWQAFAFVPETQTGCGHDLQAFPGITPLGGWSSPAGSVSLAYRELGQGRVWLVESDWQDASGSFNETSRRMLGYMIMHR